MFHVIRSEAIMTNTAQSAAEPSSSASSSSPHRIERMPVQKDESALVWDARRLQIMQTVDDLRGTMTQTFCWLFGGSAYERDCAAIYKEKLLPLRMDASLTSGFEHFQSTILEEDAFPPNRDALGWMVHLRHLQTALSKDELKAYAQLSLLESGASADS
jgi:hypothetical protein